MILLSLCSGLRLTTVQTNTMSVTQRHAFEIYLQPKLRVMRVQALDGRLIKSVGLRL